MSKMEDEFLREDTSLEASNEALKRERAMLVEALKFYAYGSHFIQHQEVWESVSGEPENFLEDENNTATVEDGSVAKQALSATEKQSQQWMAEETAKEKGALLDKLDELAHKHGENLVYHIKELRLATSKCKEKI